MKTLTSEEIACLATIAVILLITSLSFIYLGFVAADLLFG